MWYLALPRKHQRRCSVPNTASSYALYGALYGIPALYGRPQLYDMALQSLLASPSDHGRLLELAKRWWPCGCFNLAALADAVAARWVCITVSTHVCGSTSMVRLLQHGGAGSGEAILAGCARAHSTWALLPHASLAFTR